MITPDTKVADGLTERFYIRLCAVIDSPLANFCSELLQKKEYARLLDVSVNPMEYDSAREFADDYLVVSFFKKYPDFPVQVDREGAALKKWRDAEASCRIVNLFHQSWLEGETPYPFRVSSHFENARRKIAKILGVVDYRVIAANCRFGPGIDLSTRGLKHSTYNKFATRGSCTPWVIPLASDLFSEDYREDFFQQAELAVGNRLAFVPKNAKTHRSIGVEPRWNIFTQLGIGEAIVNRLQLIGIDLKDQSRNQLSAKRALTSKLATLDLSNSSDSLSKVFAYSMLPDDWADLLSKARSPTSTYRGEVIPLEKFSSMGNGYTFPLETLIFYALAFSVVEDLGADTDEIRVYGDDIIVPSEAASALIETLSYAGFSINVDKTFIEGVFFESCGSDFWCGVNVRPFFQRRALHRISDLYILANQIVEYACQETDFADNRWFGLWEWVVSQIPPRGRLYGSRGTAGVLAAPFDLCKPRRAGNGWEGWRFDSWVPVSRKGYGGDFHGHLYTKLSADVDTGNWYDIPKSSVWRRRQSYVSTYREFTWV